MSAFKVGDAVRITAPGWIEEFGEELGTVAEDQRGDSVVLNVPSFGAVHLRFHEKEVAPVQDPITVGSGIGGGLCLSKLL